MNFHSFFIVRHLSFGGAISGALALFLVLTLPATTIAQSYPSRTIRYIVGYTEG